MNDQKYILDEDHNLVPVDLMTWARWFENIDNRRVAQTTVGNVWISTVFLGLDHRFGGDGPPVLFETMVFPAVAAKAKSSKDFGDLDMARYCTWDEAVAGHEAMVKEWRRK